MNALTAMLLKLALPTIAGALAFAVSQWTKHAWARLDAQPAFVKQGVVAFWASIFNVLAQHVPAGTLCRDGAAFCNPPELAFSAVISYALAVTLHGNKRGR